MTKSYIIGNGTSRKGFDLNQLTDGITIGCNSIYRDFTPDYVIGLDYSTRNKIDRIEDKPFRAILRRTDELGMHWLYCDDKPMLRISDVAVGPGNFRSGQMAACYAAQVLDCDPIVMIGIDFGRKLPDSGTPNDMYSSRNYPEDAGNGGYIIRAWRRLFAAYPKKRWIRVGDIPACDADFYRQYFGDTRLELINYEEMVSI